MWLTNGKDLLRDKQTYYIKPLKRGGNNNARLNRDDIQIKAYCLFLISKQRFEF
jgi:hypothetical protein